MVQSAALAVDRSLGNDQFKASTGWLDSFKKRHNILWNGVCGESKDVDESVVSEFKPKQLELISPYEQSPPIFTHKQVCTINMILVDFIYLFFIFCNFV
jgi:hypothetical protein